MRLKLTEQFAKWKQRVKDKHLKLEKRVTCVKKLSLLVALVLRVKWLSAPCVLSRLD